MDDMFGREIEVGDRVVFPTGAAAGLGLKAGAVTLVGEGENWAGRAFTRIGVKVMQGTSRWAKAQANESFPRPDRIVVVDKGFYL